MDMQWMPHIDRTLCTGCRTCITVCPTDALAQRDGKAHLAHPDQCIYCTFCEDVCPVGAIELPFLITSLASTHAHSPQEDV